MNGLSIKLQGLILSKVVYLVFYIKYPMHFTGKGNVVEFDVKVCKYDAKVLNSHLCKMS